MTTIVSTQNKTIDQQEQSYFSVCRSKMGALKKPRSAYCNEPKTDYRFSTSQLDTARSAIKVVAGCAAFCAHPLQALSGALGGAVVRVIIGDSGKAESEKANRATLTASICFTVLSTAYATMIPQSMLLPNSVNDFLKTAAPLVAGYAGYQGISNGIYPLLRKLFD